MGDALLNSLDITGGTAPVNKREIQIESFTEDNIVIDINNADLRNFISLCLGHEYKTIRSINLDDVYSLSDIDISPILIISDFVTTNKGEVTAYHKLKSNVRTAGIPIICILNPQTDKISRNDNIYETVTDFLVYPFIADELLIRAKKAIKESKKRVDRFNYENAFLRPTSELPVENKILKRAREIIESNLSEPRFGVEALADGMSMSRTNLFRKLKAITGMSPNEFINEIRLQRAAELIRLKNDSITQIGYSVGFAEQSYFTKRFKKKFGVLPSKFNFMHVG